MRDDLADGYADFEERHWWCIGRRRILRRLFERHLRLEPEAGVLEVGVGAGVNLYTIYPPGLRLTGLEPHRGNAAIARARGDVPVYDGTTAELPPELDGRTFEAITLLDVLEHIEDDRAALEELRVLLAPGGLLVVAVPAYAWMWGRQDTASRHYRRYTLRSLTRLLTETGFEIERRTYFNTLLFPLIAALRLAARLRPERKDDPGSDFDVDPGPFNRLLAALFGAERHFLAVADFPFGVSAFVVARKT